LDPVDGGRQLSFHQPFFASSSPKRVARLSFAHP
jgi:hypothetical protein